MLRLRPLCGSFTADRHESFGAFGNVTGNWLEPPYALRSKALTQRIDQDRATLHSIGIVAVFANKLALSRGNGFGASDSKSNRFKAEAGILRRRLGFELELDHPRDMGDIARRQRQPDVDRRYFAIDTIEAKPQCSRSHIVTGEHVHERLHQAAGAGDDRFLRDDRFEQITQRVIDRRRDDGHQRFVHAAERLIDTPQQLRRKTRGKGCPRLVEKRADGFETEPA